jgi:hypothetical protein
MSNNTPPSRSDTLVDLEIWMLTNIPKLTAFTEEQVLELLN